MPLRRVTRTHTRVVEKRRGPEFVGAAPSEDTIPVVDYGSMGRDELVDHFIDDGGLARFIDAQMKGVPEGEWDWRIIARDLRAFVPYLTFSPEYARELYEMQRRRGAA